MVRWKDVQLGYMMAEMKVDPWDYSTAIHSADRLD